MYVCGLTMTVRTISPVGEASVWTQFADSILLNLNRIQLWFNSPDLPLKRLSGIIYRFSHDYMTKNATALMFFEYTQVCESTCTSRLRKSFERNRIILKIAHHHTSAKLGILTLKLKGELSVIHMPPSLVRWVF